MNKLYLFFACCALFVAIEGADDNNTSKKPKSSGDEECGDIPTAHYLELGCRPIFTKRNGKCPERYECPFMTRNNDDKSCYIKNKQYAVGERLKKGEINHRCSAECFCGPNFEGKSTFQCASIECPELFHYDPKKAHCVRQYEAGDCCSRKEVCDEEEIKKLKTCTWDSETYKEGSQFYPEGTCKTCICTSDFDGTLQDSYCTDINCGLELYSPHNVRDMCAPIFLEKRFCCPIEWKCPEGDVQIEKSITVKNADPQLQCSFGNIKLNIGDKIMGTDECTTCKCEVPPMVTCVKSLNC